MIAAYQVSYFTGFNGERYTFPDLHLFEKSAKNRKRFLKEGGAIDPQIARVEIKHISHQKILITGNVARYQFSATRMGQRTVLRKVYNIEKGDAGQLVGLANWKGRKLKVIIEANCFRWKAIGMI